MELIERVGDVDLLISVGGDGTFLDASHFVDSVPLLGVNSSRSSSFGHFCLGNETTIPAVLDQIESGQVKPLRLLRLELELNGTLLPEKALNEVLVCHSNPAATSRYLIEIDRQGEEQRSSGIWIGTAAGSTGAIRAAGGEIMPVATQMYQWVVREPWWRPGQQPALRAGKLDRNRSIKVISQMRTGVLYIDGPHIEYQFGLGDELTVRASSQDLLAYTSPAANDIFCESNR